MGRVVVDNEMQGEIGWRLGIDLFQKANELLVPMTRQALSDHVPIQQTERGEQRGRAVPFIVVRHRAAPPLLQGQPGLCAIQRLDLGFFIHAEHQRAIRRIQIQADDVIELFQELFVAAQLAGLGSDGA